MTRILDNTYDYDFHGNVAAISDALSGNPGNRDMTYDALDRLTGVTASSAQGGNASFSYDPLDNLRTADQGSRQFVYNYGTTGRLANLKTPGGTTLYTFSYDPRGNQLSKTGETYTFDRANRLLTASSGGSSYVYDGLGRRVREVSGGASTYFQYGRDGQLLYTNDLKTSLRHNHVYLAGSLVAKRTVPFGTGTTPVITYQHTDALGSPVAETDEAGAVIRRERLTAYGEPADGTYQNGPGFTGHPTDAATKLSYMQQRYYDPEVGRFISADPVPTDPNTGASFNRYNYANNNPYKFVDPDGRIACKSTAQCYGIQTIQVNPGRGILRGPSIVGQSTGKSQHAVAPTNPKLEQDGFNSWDDAAKAATAAYFAKGKADKKEFQLALVKTKNGFGYLTPGWGPEGGRVVDPTRVFAAYVAAGLLGGDWNWHHGHWDSETKFSTTDFEGPWRHGYVLYMATNSGVTYALERSMLQRLAKDLSQNFRRDELQGLQAVYDDGIEGRGIK